MKMIQSGSKKFVSIVATLFVVLFGIMANGCGGGGGGGGGGVAAPGAPINFLIDDSRGQGMVTLTLTWDAPLTGGEPTTYEIYRSDTNVSVFQPANHYVTVLATADPLQFIENAGMEDQTSSYWVVAAKNAGGETPSVVAAYEPLGGEVEGFGNNFSAAMIFADNIGISGDTITGTWTKSSTPTFDDIDTATGLRPSATELLTLTEFPYFDPTTLYEDTYYKQQTVSTWQGEWIKGVGTLQEVTANWGDNLISQTQLTLNSTVRIEMVLTKTVETNMTTYNMESLYGSTRYEIYGTDRAEVNTTTAFVFAANAHLTIERLNIDGYPIEEVENQPLFSGVPDGPGKFGAEINVAGNLTYGYVWDLKADDTLSAGTYRITFSLDPESEKGTSDNTNMVACPNGTLADENTCYIQINIGQ